MHNRPYSRAGAASGAIFILLTFGALFAPGAPPRGSDSAAHIAQLLSDKRPVFLGGTFVAGVGLIFAVWFFGAVASWIRREAGEFDHGAASAAQAGGVAAVVLLMVGMLFFYGATFKVAGEGQLALVRALTDAGNAAVELSKFGVVAFIGATALSALRHGLFARRFALLGLATAGLALVSAVPLFSEGRLTEFGGGLDLMASTPSILWILGLSSLMCRRAQHPTRGGEGFTSDAIAPAQGTAAG